MIRAVRAAKSWTIAGALKAFFLWERMPAKLKSLQLFTFKAEKWLRFEKQSQVVDSPHSKIAIPGVKFSITLKFPSTDSLDCARRSRSSDIAHTWMCFLS